MGKIKTTKKAIVKTGQKMKRITKKLGLSCKFRPIRTGGQWGLSATCVKKKK